MKVVCRPATGRRRLGRQVRVTLSDDEHVALVQAAEQAGMRVTWWVAAAALAAEESDRGWCPVMWWK